MSSPISTNTNYSPTFGLVHDHPSILNRLQVDDHSSDQKKLHRWSSRLIFPDLQSNDVYKDVCSSDPRKLSQIAKDAYWQMMSDFFKDPPTHYLSRPKVMTALAVGNEIYLSSSLKGGLFLLHARDMKNPVYSELHQCHVDLQQQFKDNKLTVDHMNSANCVRDLQTQQGEILALYAYFAAHNDDIEGAIDRLRDSHIVTVRVGVNWKRSNKGSPFPYERVVRVNPCGTTDDRFKGNKIVGCFQLLRRFGVIPILEWDLENLPTDARRAQEEFVILDYNRSRMTISHVPISCIKESTATESGLGTS
ncbi:hypothetical protein K505DRAFT_339017 [Melanomma pulvis-pyrius CBS 109.77]|uniref:Uncharacterized protein n=1 Tax=Melanomma pulvis-pyrius CBS 109.77 TaxID=1314802 RepID=A0A6A6X6R0_9PLEO|nr:hypothetical protein K505DRAFT_339017 [Melanomma pulvis-pyrius CBS 109.77]